MTYHYVITDPIYGSDHWRNLEAKGATPQPSH